MARMVATLLFVPMAYSVIALMIDLVVAALLWYEWHVYYLIWPVINVSIIIIVSCLPIRTGGS